MRIALVCVTAESLDAEIANDLALVAACVGAEVIEWPPIEGEWDHDAMHHVRSMIVEPRFDTQLGPFYVVVDSALVASAGFFGPPDETLEVEIGYSVCRRNWRQGVATEIVAELCRRAAVLGCVSVSARVCPANLGSIKALRRNGFVASASNSDDELVVLRRVLDEAAHIDDAR